MNMRKIGESLVPKTPFWKKRALVQDRLQRQHVLKQEEETAEDEDVVVRLIRAKSKLKN